VDYTNVFAQADIKEEEVFVELPRDDYAASESGDFVLKLNKSLFGLRKPNQSRRSRGL
jgi:hypothetical protein